MKKINARKINFFARKYITTQIIQIFITMLVAFIFLKIFTYNLKDSFDITILLSFLILAMSFVLAKVICFIVTKCTEDISKVSEDCDALIKKYAAMNLISYKGITYPGECICTLDSSTQIIIM